MKKIKCPGCKHEIKYIDFIKSQYIWNLYCSHCKSKLSLSNSSLFFLIIVELLWVIGVIGAGIILFNLKNIPIIIIILIAGALTAKYVLYFLINQFDIKLYLRDS